MAKFFITDELNDSYTAGVTQRGRVRTAEFAQTHYAIPSAASSAMTVLNNGTCWLKSVIVGSLPATATALLLWDTATSAASALTETSGANRITKIRIPAAAGSVAVSGDPSVETSVIPLNVYCASGLTYNLGGDGTLTGNSNSVTIVYEDL
jgi:hypothetical protein